VLRPPGGKREERAQDCQEAHSANQDCHGPGLATARFLPLVGGSGVGTRRTREQRSPRALWQSKMKAPGILAAIPPFNRTRKNSKKARFRYPISETNPKQ
jgi:hypothetical protein